MHDVCERVVLETPTIEAIIRNRNIHTPHKQEYNRHDTEPESVMYQEAQTGRYFPSHERLSTFDHLQEADKACDVRFGHLSGCGRARKPRTKGTIGSLLV